MQRIAQVRPASPRGTSRRSAAIPPPSRDRVRQERSRRVNAVAEAFARLRAMHRGRA